MLFHVLLEGRSWSGRIVVKRVLPAFYIVFREDDHLVPDHVFICGFGSFVTGDVGPVGASAISTLSPTKHHSEAKQSGIWNNGKWVSFMIHGGIECDWSKLLV